MTFSLVFNPLATLATPSTSDELYHNLTEYVDDYEIEAFLELVRNADVFLIATHYVGIHLDATFRAGPQAFPSVFPNGIISIRVPPATTSSIQFRALQAVYMAAVSFAFSSYTTVINPRSGVVAGSNPLW